MTRRSAETCLAASGCWKLRAYWLFFCCWGLVCQLADQPARVGQVEHDQAVGQIGMGHGERPGDQPAPVVPDDDRLAVREMLDDREHVADELVGRVVLARPRAAR